MKKLRAVSLFANVGIAETYLKDHNIKTVLANELLPERAKFYKDMYPNHNVLCGDITNEDIYSEISKQKDIDLLIATPPCQGMSIVGKMQEDDPRNSLIIYAIQAICDIQPKNAIIENVPGMLNTYVSINSEKIKIPDFITNKLEALGYFVNFKVIDCADFGTPQTRKRSIFLISKIKEWEFPQTEDRITVRQAIEHLPSLESGEISQIKYHYARVHNERHIECMKHTPSGKSAMLNEVFYPKKADGTKVKAFNSSYKRIEWDKPAPTITMANGAISSQNNVHPGRKKEDSTYSDARVLSLKEIFILTGLPDDWTPPEWVGENLIREVIGEGVPPKLIDRLLSTMPGRNNE